MNLIFGKNVQIYSFPLGKDLEIGYSQLVTCVCDVMNKDGHWTGFLVNDTVLTSGIIDHEKEFDVQFYKQPKTSGFLLHDFGDTLELAVGNRPKVDKLAGGMKPPSVGERLFVIGNFFGKPFEIATFDVEFVGYVKDLKVMDEEQMDMHTCGSPVFNHDGVLVGICEAYVHKTNQLIARSLTVSKSGLLK